MDVNVTYKNRDTLQQRAHSDIGSAMTDSDGRDGNLVIRNADGKMVAIYAAGEWVYVERVKE